jgi:hypothetical protein
VSANDDLIRQVAAMRQEIADLKGKRTSFRQATVVATDTDTATFTADVDGAGWLSGIPVPLEYLPEVGDVVPLSLDGATPIYRPSPTRITALDAEGNPYQVAKLGQPSGIVDSNGNTIWQVDENGRQTTQDLSVNGDPILMGVPFTEHIAPFAKFQAGASRGGNIDPAATSAGGGETGYVEAAFEFEPGIPYEIKSSNIWVRPSQTTTNRIDVNVRYTVSTTRGVDPPSVNLSSPLFMRHVQATDGNFSTIGHQVILQRIFKVPVYAHIRMLISLGSVGGSAYIEMGSANHTDGTLGVTIEPEVVQLYVNDLGYHPWTNRAATNTGSGSPAAIKKETREYTATWSRRFRGDGTTQSTGGNVAQGYNPNRPDLGDQKSQIGGFQRSGVDIATDLASSTIEKLELRLYGQHWSKRTGGTALIHYHDNTAAGTWSTVSAAEIQVPGWGRGEERWVDITDWADEFLADTAEGIAIGPSGGIDPLYYGVFHGPAGASPPVIRATITK